MYNCVFVACSNFNFVLSCDYVGFYEFVVVLLLSDIESPDLESGDIDLSTWNNDHHHNHMANGNKQE